MHSPLILVQAIFSFFCIDDNIWLTASFEIASQIALMKLHLSKNTCSHIESWNWHFTIKNINLQY